MTPGDLARVARPDAAPSASGARVCARCNTLRAASDYSGAARPGGRDYLDVCRMCRTALHAAARAQAKRDGTCFVHGCDSPHVRGRRCAEHQDSDERRRRFLDLVHSPIRFPRHEAA